MSANRAPKYYALYLTEDNDFRITAHYTRKEAEEYLLAIATKDGFEATTFSELEEVASEKYLGGDTMCRLEVGVFENVCSLAFSSI